MVITKTTVVITKVTGDYKDHCGDNEMIGDYKVDCGDCEDDCGIGCDAVQCRRSCRLHIFFHRYKQFHAPRLHNPEGHLYAPAGRNTSRMHGN